MLHFLLRAMPRVARRVVGMSSVDNRRWRFVGAGAVLLLSACDRQAENVQTPSAAAVVIATATDPDALLPPLVATTAGKQVVDLLYDHLADPKGPRVQTDGDAGFSPRLASRWNWSADSLSVAFSLDPKARWHDGKPVTAADVVYSFNLYVDPRIASIHASGFAGIDSVTERDAQTAVVWWHARHPEQFFQIAYNLAIMPKHVYGAVPADSLATSALVQAPIGSGRYRFEKWTRQQSLVVQADSSNYRGRPRFDRVIWTVYPDANAAANAVLQGQADVIEVLRGEAVAKAAASPAVKTVEYGSQDYGYLVFNQAATKGKTSLFADRALRLALSGQVNRAELVANALDSLGAPALGPVTRAMATADTSIRPPAFDTLRTAMLLDSLGWRWNSAHTARMRGTTPLTFSVLFPASSGTRRRLAVLLQEQFRRQGITVTVDAAEPAIFAQRLRTGDFETALNVWRDDPSPAGIRQAWGTPRGADVGANFGRYSNPAFDALVDSAAQSFDPMERRRRFALAYRQILDDAPAIWLYEPRNLAAVRRNLSPVAIRADAWLAGLGDWGVNP